jgi:hypothetical protein
MLTASAVPCGNRHAATINSTRNGVGMTRHPCLLSPCAWGVVLTMGSLLQMCILCAAEPAAVADTPDFIYLDAQRLARNLEQARAGREPFQAARRKVIRDADAAWALPRFSVMDKTQVPPSGDKHDYLSLAPYWWPDPQKPDGLPWISKDGEVNPATRGEHTDLRRWQRFLDAVEALSLAWLCTDEVKYADKARELLEAWFVDAATRMNPHLKYGQAVPGLNEGRGAGIIETVGIDNALIAIQILERRQRLPAASRSALQRWFSDYLAWLQTSPEGLAEGRARNNHSTHYDSQVVAILLFLGRNAEAAKVLEEVKTRRIAVQIRPDGSMPAELARTKSLSYSIMNLRGFTRLARLGRQAGVDLWGHASDDGRGLQQAYRFLAPFAAGTTPWSRKQLGNLDGMLSKELPQLYAFASVLMDDPGFHPSIVARAPALDARTILFFGSPSVTMAPR